MKKRSIAIFLAALAFLTALALTLYPVIAAEYNEAHQSKALHDYWEMVNQKDNTEKERIIESARRYNEALCSGVIQTNTENLSAAESESYMDQLNIEGNGIMGYIRIPSIGVNLPIFHGTDDKTLAKGAGHLFGSSLPVGGTGTHAVLTGHSGMASQRVFSDLIDMKAGDVFYLDVIGERLAYEVKEIHVVTPYDTSLLEIIPNEDLCTLVTCTPYGINTHRLLIRGSRTPYTASTEESIAPDGITPLQSTWERHYVKGLCAGVLIVAVSGSIIFVFRMIRRKCHE